MRGADRPGADHDDDVVEADVDVLVAADDVGERVGERRVRGRQPVGDAEQVLERDVRDDHALGVGAGVVEAHQLAVEAEVLRAAAAHPAAPAPQRRDAVDRVADRDAARRDLLLGARADLDDLAGDLVAEHPRRLDAAVAVVERAHVGAADAAREHVQEHAVLGADRVRGGADIHRPRPVPDRCAHCSSSVGSTGASVPVVRQLARNGDGSGALNDRVHLHAHARRRHALGRARGLRVDCRNRRPARRLQGRRAARPTSSRR